MSYQKLLANSQSLADLLDENMPDLPQDKPTPEGEISLKTNPLMFKYALPLTFKLVTCVLLRIKVSRMV